MVRRARKTQPNRSPGWGVRRLPVVTRAEENGATVVDETEDNTSSPADQGISDAGLDALVLNVTVGAYLASPSPGTSAASR